MLDDLNKAGALGKYGASWDDIRAAFQCGQVAMYLDSSAGVRDLIDASKFNVGVSYIPYPEDSKQNGVVIGGASLWMTNMVSEETQQGAWDFMKYLTKPTYKQNGILQQVISQLIRMHIMSH